MGSSLSRSAASEDAAPTATLFYESYAADQTWRDFAKLAETTVNGFELQLCDVAAYPARAAAERLHRFPAIVVACPRTRTRTTLQGETMMAELEVMLLF